MRKLIYNAFVAISAIVLIGATGCWAMSYFYETRVSWSVHNNDYLLASLRGRLLIQADTNVGIGTGWHVEFLPQSLTASAGPGYEHDMDFRFLGFGYERRSGFGFLFGGFGRWTRDSYVLPFWIVVALSIVPVLHRLVNRRRHTEPGCCAACGYNLAGTKGQACPECGGAIREKRRPAAKPRASITRG